MSAAEEIISGMEEHHNRILSRLQPQGKDHYEPGSGDEDPEVRYLNEQSARRVIFAGEDLVEVKLPAGARIISARKPQRGLGDPRGAIRYALLHPLDMKPLPDYLKPDMKVTIAVDDLSLPLPMMKKPDLRGLMMEETIRMLDDAGVEDVHIIIATALHRRMKPSEMRRMSGSEIYDRFHPDRYYNHDAEKPGGLKAMGHTEKGEHAELNSRAAESDLLIYLNINFVPMNGGPKSVATGLAGYQSIREHHDPEVIVACNSYMDPTTSELTHSNRRLNDLIESKVTVFHVESAINTAMFSKALSFLAKDEDEYTLTDRQMKTRLMKILRRLSPSAKRRIFSRVPAPYEPIAVHAGQVEAVHERIVETSRRQYTIKVKGQADILVLGIPFVCPYSVNSILNPLLVQVMAMGYLYHLYEGGVPLLRDGGSMIIFHPCRDEFDAKCHPSYSEFFNRLLPESRDSVFLQKKYEAEFATNAEYKKIYREAYGYHGVHPFYMWYWGEKGRRNLGRVIVVGAEDKHVPPRLGWENAESFDQALVMASRGMEEPQVTMLRTSPMLVTKCI